MCVFFSEGFVKAKDKFSLDIRVHWTINIFSNHNNSTHRYFEGRWVGYVEGYVLLWIPQAWDTPPPGGPLSRHFCGQQRERGRETLFHLFFILTSTGRNMRWGDWWDTGGKVSDGTATSRGMCGPGPAALTLDQSPARETLVKTASCLETWTGGSWVHRTQMLQHLGEGARVMGVQAVDDI